jgi:glycosyltransferase involved in cell wall biosynthesis
MHSLAEYGMMQLSDGIFTCSQYLKTQAVSAYKVNKEKIKCLYPGISFSFWAFRLRDYNNSNMLEEILFVKGDYKNGGLSVLLRALKRLNKFTFRLHIAGTPALQQPKLNKLLNKYKSLDIICYGQISPHQVRNLMYQCNTLCVPSINEGFGIINIEGLATGISVVTTLTGGIPEVFPSEKYGWTIPPADDMALAEALGNCWQDKEERTRRALAGREMVENNFSDHQLQHNFIQCLISEPLK